MGKENEEPWRWWWLWLTNGVGTHLGYAVGAFAIVDDGRRGGRPVGIGAAVLCAAKRKHAANKREKKSKTKSN